MDNCKICGKKDWNESETRCNSCGHELIESGSVIKINPADLPPWHWRDVAHNFKKRAEKAEAENAQLKSWLDDVTDFAYYDNEHEEAICKYIVWREGQNNPSASAEASALDDTPKAH